MVKFLAAITIVLSACTYDTSYGDCAVHCTADAVDSGCPDGLTCGPEGVCRAAEAEACVLPNDGTGGVITHVDGRTIHTFSVEQSGSTFFPPADVSDVELLVVAGGGGGGSTRGGGGGGAGGLVHMLSFAITQQGYVVLMGYGGGPSTSGGNSSFGTIMAIGGGAGRPSSTPSGGSGGGADHGGSSGGAGLAGQGNSGGSGGYNDSNIAFTGAGGGGAGGAGGNGVSSGGGAGGPGLALTISGEHVYYAGGGGGGSNQRLESPDLSPGVGGGGGGGDGGIDAIGKDGADGTGGGGGAGGGGPDPNFFRGGRGGNGVVIVSYATSWRDSQLSVRSAVTE